jgi:hypothetical protein
MAESYRRLSARGLHLVEMGAGREIAGYEAMVKDCMPFHRLITRYLFLYPVALLTYL